MPTFSSRPAMPLEAHARGGGSVPGRLRCWSHWICNEKIDVVRATLRNINKIEEKNTELDVSGTRLRLSQGACGARAGELPVTRDRNGWAIRTPKQIICTNHLRQIMTNHNPYKTAGSFRIYLALLGSLEILKAFKCCSKLSSPALSFTGTVRV